MSRLIVKKLPEKVTNDKLKELFSEYGIVTDVQLKFNKKGEFRKFAFIGYKDKNSADIAVKNLNNTFIKTSKIQVELCTTLDEKPKSKRKIDATKEIKPDPVKKKKTGKIKDDELIKQLEMNKNDEMFNEFLESHRINRDEVIPKDTEEKETKKDADNQKISDLEYFNKKIKTDLENAKVKPNKLISTDRHTVKLSNLPFKVHKKDLKDFFRPLKLISIRRPVNVKGIAYCDFAEEKDLRKALIKNRSFIGTKRVTVKIYSHTSDENVGKEKWTKEEERLKGEESVGESGRIFVRNLAYTITEEDLKPLFEKYGPVTEIILPIDILTRKPKGFGFITFLMPEHACKAFNELDGSIVQGRMLHLIPGIPKKEPDEDDNAGLTFKQKKLKKQKADATNEATWNTFFINSNSLTEAMAAMYNTTKETVLDDNGSKAGAAVRLALGETQMIQKTKDYLERNGVSLDAFANITQRSENVILVKNLPFQTELNEIIERFKPLGELNRVLLSPFGGTAVVEFIEQSEAKKAFKRLAYSKFKFVPLYLEWAPKGIFDGKKPEEVKQDQNEDSVEVSGGEGCMLFVKNLNFTTTSEALRKHFEQYSPVSASVAIKKDTKNPGQTLSMGYGFVEFGSKEKTDDALKSLQFTQLEGHRIEIKRSHRTTASSNDVKRKDNTRGKPSYKMIIRNVPFQATEQEIRELVKVFGQLKAVRMPKKMVGTGTHRGFCFVEFVSKSDAKRAFDALSESTHLYGRRLVLEWAASDDDVETLRQKTAKQFQAGNVQAANNKKTVFKNIDDVNDDEDE